MHKCKGNESKKYKVKSCTKKSQVDVGGLVDNVLIDGNKTFHIASSIAFNSDFSLTKFMNMFSYFLAPPMLNTINRFKLIDIL